MIVFPRSLVLHSRNSCLRLHLRCELRNMRAKRAGVRMEDSSEEVAADEIKKVECLSPTLGDEPSPGALVLFNCSDVDQWVNGKLIDCRTRNPLRPVLGRSLQQRRAQSRLTQLAKYSGDHLRVR
jgi:hypothetical protein